MDDLTLILGAGVTVAEAQSHRPQQTKEHPPLDTNFFSKASQIEPDRYGATLQNFAGRVGLPDPFGDTEPRMEEFFGDTYYEVMEATEDEEESALAAYRALLRLYNRVLAKTTNWFWNRPRGAIGRLFRALLDLDLDSVTLVTFNHDLAIENALVQLPYHSYWCVDRGYGPISLNPVRTARRIARLPRHSEECTHNPEIVLLKLHGSLNWQVPTRSHDPEFRDLFPPEGSDTEISCILDRKASVTLQRKGESRSWRYWPQVVPPIYEKRSIISARFGELWTASSMALEESDWVAMIGYSIPSADMHTQGLLKRTLRVNDTLKRVDVVNPDPDIASRLAGLGGLSSLHYFADIPYYTDFLQAGSIRKQV